MKSKILFLFIALSSMVIKSQAQWSLTGNSGTSPGTNFIGTTDGQSLIIKTDNTERIKVTDTGTVIFKSQLGTGNEKIFSINGGTTGGGSLTDLFSLRSSGGWEFKSQWTTPVLGFAAGNNTLYCGPYLDIDFTSAGEVRAGNVGVNKIRGVGWYQTEIAVNRPGIEYKSIGSSWVETNTSAHKFTVGSALTESGTKIASFDNGGSDLVVITKDGGVGINTGNPGGYKLKVSGNSSLTGPVDVGTAFGDNSVALSVASDLNWLQGTFTETGIQRFMVKQDGKTIVNGGASNPGGASYQFNVFSPSGAGARIVTNTSSVDYPMLDLKDDNSGVEMIMTSKISSSNGGVFGTYTDHPLFFAPNKATAMTINTSGNVGIGTTTPNTNARLDVNGNIFTNGKIAIGTTDMTKISSYSLVVNGEALFTKARVKLYTNWPDYVFEEKYNLLPIAQLDQYIKINKHLPGIPAAAEVAKDGIDLGGNQALLLQKIEELTLYIIEQNKKMEVLEKKVEKLEKN